VLVNLVERAAHHIEFFGEFFSECFGALGMSSSAKPHSEPPQSYG